MKETIIIYLLFCSLSLKSQNYTNFTVLDSLFSNEIKGNNVIVGENHYQSENNLVYKSILNSMNKDTRLFIEGPFFMNILIDEWINNKNPNLINFRNDYSKLADYDFKSNLIDSILVNFQDSGREILRNFRYVDLNDLSFWINRKYVLKLLFPYINDFHLKSWIIQNLEKESFSDEDWEIFSTVVFECKVPDNELWKKFRSTLFNEIENRSNLPISSKSKLETFAFRELFLLDYFNFFRYKISPNEHFFVIAGIGHVSRDNSIRLEIRKIPDLHSFTSGIPKSKYYNLFYLSKFRKPYTLHIGCRWERKILKTLLKSDSFPQIIEVEKWNNSYDKMIVL